MDNPFQFPNVLSFCPGILGLERGLIRAIGKINVVAYVEREAFIIANLIAGMQAGVLDARPVWTDAKTFHTVAKSFRNKVHILLGGYPCQPFSLAGQRKGAEDPRHLWPSLSRTIEAIGPVCCFFENVSGHLSMGFDEVYRDLRRLGYAVEAGIFTAEEVGAPHERERLFILAISDNFKWRLAEWQPRQKWESSIKDVDISRAGEELADTNSESGQSPTTIGLDLERNTLFEAGRNESADGSESFNKTELEHAAGRRCEQCNQRHWVQCIAYPGCETMADTNECGGVKNPQLSKFWTVGTKQSSVNSGITEPGKNDKKRKGEMEYSNDTRCRELSGTVAVPTKFTPIECTCAFNGNSTDRWPAGPGQQQYDWEEPRTAGYVNRLPSTIRTMWSEGRKDFAKMLGEEVFQETDLRLKANFESKLGSAINGYNFREDLLRALGNSVVEQTAEIAFLNLLQKHLKNLK